MPNDANIVHTLGQCIWDGRAHYTFHQVKERYLGYLGIIPNQIGTIWVVSLGWPWNLGAPIILNHAMVPILGWNPNLLLFQFSFSFQSGQKIWSWRPKGCSEPPKKPRVAREFPRELQYISLQQIILLKKLISFKYIYLIWTPLIHSGRLWSKSIVMLCYVMLCYVIITMTTSRTNRKRLKIHMGENNNGHSGLDTDNGNNNHRNHHYHHGFNVMFCHQSSVAQHI